MKLTKELQNFKSLREISSILEFMRIPGVGAELFKEAILKFQNPIKMKTKIQEDRNFQKKIEKRKIGKNKNEDRGLIERTINYLKDLPSNESFTYFGAPDYPSRLISTSEPPPILFFKGNPELLENQNSVAIVGSRHPSNRGITLSCEIARSFARSGWLVVSGGANGIDTVVHETVLANRGFTAAVIGCGIDVKYPKENKFLYEKISRNGLILTEFFPTTPPIASHFPTRNRIIASLADFVILVEGTEKSGGIYTIKKAIKEGRPTFCLEGDGLLSGAKNFIQKTLKKVKIVKSLKEIFGKMS
ncbi:MAG: DNA-protecting protein DprA [Candidatus Riflebacteria bacterium]|nr:DNA-protecting protein DprA [Candidatus Riflebacteria bacterium]